MLLVAPIGGPERKVAEVSSRFAALGAPAWAPDAKSLAIPDWDAQGADGITLESIDTGDKRQLTSPPAASSHDYAPAFSPDGRTLAFVRAKQRGADVLALPLSTGLTPEGGPGLLTSHTYMFFGLTWTLDGQQVVVVPGIDEVRQSVEGCRRWSGRREQLPFVGDEVANPSLSRLAGRVAYANGAVEDRNIWRLDLTAPEARRSPQKICSSTRNDASAQFSPDGKRIAFHSNRSGHEQIWVCSSDGTSALQITSLGGPRCGTPRWSPGGDEIVFEANPESNWDIFAVPVSGGAARRLTAQSSQEAIPSWSHDGTWIYFWSDRTGTPQIWRMPNGGGAAVQVTRQGGFAAQESPDGRFLYYTKTDDGGDGLWRMPVSGGAETRILHDAIATRAFFVTADSIYFIKAVAGNRPPISSVARSPRPSRSNLRTGQTRTLARIANPWLY